MNIGLLTGETLSGFRLNTLKPILADDSFSIKLAVIDTRPEKTMKEKFRKHLHRGRGGYILVMALNKLFLKKENTIPTKQFCQENGIAPIETQKPYSPEITALIKKHRLDVLLLIGGFGIVKEALLNITPLGVLSYHHGNMRKYRGMPPALWELYHNEPEMGVTVQLLTPGLDCGIPIEEKTINIIRNDSLSQLRNRAQKDSTEMMYKALLKLSDPDFEPTRISEFGQVFTLPNLSQWIMLNIKILWRKLKYYILPNRVERA